MVLTQVGPITAALESFAAAVGAGIVLGGFVIGAARLMAGRTRRELEDHVLTDGYAGGMAAACVVFLDLILRYG